MNYAQLINLIEESFVPNKSLSVTAEKIRKALLETVAFANITQGDYQGTAAPTDNPGTPEGPVYYFANASGTYTNFGGLAVTASEGINILSYSGSAWSKAVVPVDLTGYAEVTVVNELLEEVGLKVNSLPKKNQFNINSTGNSIGYYVSGGDGNLVISAGFNVTHFIPVQEGTTYAVNYKHNIAWYDQNKTFISGNFTVGTTAVITAPVNARFFRATVSTAKWPTYQLEKGNTVTPFEPYETTALEEFWKKTDLPEAELAKKSDLNSKVEGIVGKNIFNIIDVGNVIGQYISGGNGALVNGSGYNATHFIPVEGGTTYAVNYKHNTAWYDQDKVFVSGSYSVSGTAILTAPANARFFRATVSTVKWSTYQMEKGNAVTAFEPYEILPLTKFWNKNELPESTFENILPTKVNLNFTSFGDSLTNQELWQPKIIAKLDSTFNITHNKRGVDGARICGNSPNSFYQDSRIETIPTNTQFLTILGGTNDWGQSRVLGEVDSTNTEDFCGALNVVITKVIDRVPLVRIIFLTPVWSEYIDFSARGWTSKETNTLGLTINDYADAIKNVCKMRNVPVIDLNQSVGWNSLNISNFMTNDGAYLHPNDSGAKRMASAVSDYLRMEYL